MHKKAELLRVTTRDISIRGVYFVTEQEFALGSQLDFTLTLPAQLTHGTEVLVRARGKVVRAEKKRENGAERVGVAAKIEKFDIVRAKVISP